MNKRMNRAIWLALLIGIFLLLCCSCGNSGGNSDGNSDGNGSVAEGGSTGEADSGKCEHLFDEGTVLRAAGCDRDGEMRYTCSLCGYSYTKAIPGGHTPVKDLAVPATCSAEGKTEGSHCSVCGTVLTAQKAVPKMEHDPVLSPAVEATCSAEGNTEGLRCKNCGMMFTGTVIPKKAHATVKDPAVPATCLSEGKTEGSHCSVCGTVLTAQVTVPKSGHTPVKDPAVPATCSAEGKTEGSHCSVCGKVLTAQVTVPKGGHTPVKDPAVPATCSAEGKTEGSHCSVCGKVLTAQVTVPKSGHQFADGWTSDGAYHWHASTCGHTSEVSEKAAHSYSDGVCSVCGAKDPRVAVKVYIDGILSETLYTDEEQGYRITAPKKPADITTDPNAEGYFYAWFTDRDFQVPLLDTTEFRRNGAIYGKWIQIDYSCFTYTVSEGKATITKFNNSYKKATVVIVPAYINGFPVEAISSAFENDTWLRTVILCNGIEKISTDAFKGCNSITQIDLPESLTEIGSRAFAGCSILQDIRIPGNVKSIGDYAFSGCTRLQSITIPDGVTSIGENALYGCETLMSITFPFMSTHIGYYFGENWPTGQCKAVPSSLKTVVITGGTHIANFAFYGCTGIQSVTIQNSATSIGENAFYGCTGLQSIAIPSGVTEIGEMAFVGCAALTSITVADGNPVYHSSGNCLIETASKTLLLGCQNSVIPADGSVTSIGVCAFYGCTGLQNITIPDSVTSIGAFAFRDCTGLQSIVIPDSVTSIGGSAFKGCTELQSITLPFTGNAIEGDYPFFGYIFGASEADSQDQNVPSSLKSVTITKHIGEEAFKWCQELQSITISDGVTSIGASAFSGCAGLQSITIPDSVTSIGEGAFVGCAGLQSITVAPGNKKYHSAGNCLIETASKTLIAGCQNSVIPADGSVTSIGDSAFRGCTGLQSITIPYSVTWIDEYAFAGCTGLTSVKFKGDFWWDLTGYRTSESLYVSEARNYCKELVETYCSYRWRRTKYTESN